MEYKKYDVYLVIINYAYYSSQVGAFRFQRSNLFIKREEIKKREDEVRRERGREERRRLWEESGRGRERR